MKTRLIHKTIRAGDAMPPVPEIFRPRLETAFWEYLSDRGRRTHRPISIFTDTGLPRPLAMLREMTFLALSGCVTYLQLIHSVTREVAVAFAYRQIVAHGLHSMYEEESTRAAYVHEAFRVTLELLHQERLPMCMATE